MTRDVGEVEGLGEVLLAEAGMVRDWLRPLVDCADPDLKAVDRFVKVIDLEARLGGVYKPLGSALIAERFTTCGVRLDSTIPSRDFGTPVATPDRTARAAASASVGSVLP
jgi:hypothetical protein